MSTKLESYTEFLKREGYVPETLANGDIQFKVQGESLVLTAADNDPNYFKLTYFHRWNPEDTDASWHALNIVNGRIKVVKVCVAQDVIFLTTEALVARPEDFETLLPAYVRLLGAGIQALREALAAIRPANPEPVEA